MASVIEIHNQASVLSRIYCRVQSYPVVPIQGAARREWLVLCKGCNAVLEQQGSSLRAGREAAVRYVALLGKDAPLPAKHALRSTASRPAEPYNIRVTLHLLPLLLQPFRCTGRLSPHDRIHGCPVCQHKSLSSCFQRMNDYSFILMDR